MKSRVDVRLRESLNKRVLIMFCLVSKNSKFPVHKWRFDKNDPHCSVTLSKSNVFLLIYCKLKANSMAKNQL